MSKIQSFLGDSNKFDKHGNKPSLLISFALYGLCSFFFFMKLPTVPTFRFLLQMRYLKCLGYSSLCSNKSWALCAAEVLCLQRHLGYLYFLKSEISVVKMSSDCQRCFNDIVFGHVLCMGCAEPMSCCQRKKLDCSHDNNFHSMFSFTSSFKYMTRNDSPMSHCISTGFPPFLQA